MKLFVNEVFLIVLFLPYLELYRGIYGRYFCIKEMIYLARKQMNKAKVALHSSENQLWAALISECGKCTFN